MFKNMCMLILLFLTLNNNNIVSALCSIDSLLVFVTPESFTIDDCPATEWSPGGAHSTSHFAISLGVLQETTFCELKEADEICKWYAANSTDALLASRVAYGGAQFKAVLSNSDEFARNRFFYSRKSVCLVGGQTVADGLHTMFLGVDWLSRINRNHNGELVSQNPSVWTGTTRYGNRTNNCGDWSNSGVTGQVGSADESDFRALEHLNQACGTEPARLYCMEVPNEPTLGQVPACRTVFATSMTTDGQFGGVAGADTICHSLSQSKNSLPFVHMLTLSGKVEYKAMLSDGAATIKRSSASLASRVNYRPDDCLERVDFVPVSPSLTLPLMTLENPIGVDERGFSVDSTVWTHFDAYLESVPATANCVGWASRAGEQTGLTGSTTTISSQWYDAGEKACNVPRRLYCMSVPLNVPTMIPTAAPSGSGTPLPTHQPTIPPSRSPTATPTKQPTDTPTKQPTRTPTEMPSPGPTVTPGSPSRAPTFRPTRTPTTTPTRVPTAAPATSTTVAVTTSTTPTTGLTPTPTTATAAATTTVAEAETTTSADSILSDLPLPMPALVGIVAAVCVLLFIIILCVVLRRRRPSSSPAARHSSHTSRASRRASTAYRRSTHLGGGRSKHASVRSPLAEVPLVPPSATGSLTLPPSVSVLSVEPLDSPESSNYAKIGFDTETDPPVGGIYGKAPDLANSAETNGALVYETLPSDQKSGVVYETLPQD